MKNRVNPNGNLNDSLPQQQVKDLQMVEILPSHEEQALIKSSMIILVSRVICKYLVAYKEFSSAVIHHIPHEFSSQMKQKAEQVNNNIMTIINRFFNIFSDCQHLFK